ncbi:polysaccharide biosynthesis/export family protein [Pontibacter fetidus]|uniref:Polysaccharide export protein n=1 Tax=Pontibacter fetidus TaxID=2700082 RepID=A0A6B2H8T7_9BACT|nr:polysaccharide biosynthesis/export family protein [Pontibacter fetidus]NDK55852.1 polysaccharide export protein [Pontibacter fetidus]
MKNIFYFLVGLVLISSCVTKKELVYMQNENLKNTAPTTFNNNVPDYKLQVNDVLSVKVLSAESELSEIYNIISPTNGFGVAEPGSLYLSGYTIDAEGNINLPNVGKLKVAGMNTLQAQKLIQQNLDRYLNGATVVVKLISFKISILGEVKMPGYYYVYNDQANLLEGLALAGDLTPAANRQNLKLIRQKPGGSEVILLDLTDPALVQSPYYYLLPNDVLYVEPRKTHLKRENLVVVTTVLSVISTAALLFNFVK